MNNSILIWTNWVFFSIVVAELLGYWLHRLIHVDKIHWLSKAHMIHHLVLYGPKTGLRSKVYRNSTLGRFGIMSIGAEWLLPVGMIMASFALIFWFLSVPADMQIVFFIIASVWAFITLNYLHDVMHLEHVWLMDVPGVRKWYFFVRHLHDIHHLEISNEGLMNKNFGIGFWFMDLIFGTYVRKMGKFNEKGFEYCKTRYSYIHGEIDRPRKD